MKKSLDQEWENRVLCSDGNCIGVIGDNGRCKECGKPYEGRLPDGFGRQPSSAVSEPPAEPESQAQEVRSAATAEHGSAPHPAGDDDWENRVLCSDGNCIGVIGGDGRCKECGKPYSPESKE